MPVDVLMGVAFGVIVSAPPVIILVRISRVHAFRIGMIDRIFDIGDDATEERLNVFYSVSHDRMVYQCWKPLRPEVWYEDTSFLEPGGVK